PNLDDVGLAFRDMNINLLELEEYIRNVDSVPCVYEIPKYPIPRDSHLNFLKPGSREVVTRPVHVHEHLPPMHPEMEEEEYGNKQTPLSVDTTVASGSTSPLASPKANVFKRPGDPISDNPALKRTRCILEEEGRPLREISSVMMTTSGFLSPAREGKLPESRTPLQPSDSRSNSPQPTSYPMVPPEVKGDKKTKKLPFKKTVEGIKKIGDKENKKKEHKLKDLAKVEKHIPMDESKVKKLVSMKELSKLKALKSGALKMMAHASATAGPSTSTKFPKISPPKITATKAPNVSSPKMGKPPKMVSPEKSKDTVVEGKLSSEPDKQKLNIFKKISKVKEEKSEKLDRSEHFDSAPRDSRESSPGLIIDESEANSRQREMPESTSSKVDETINDVVSGHASGPGSDHDVYMFDDDFSPPGTPSTPKTPELPTPSKKVQDQKEKKRKREKSKSKKEGKGRSPKGSISPKKVKLELNEPETPDRPKTPEAPDHREQTIPAPVFPFFPHFPPAPGLIPPPIGHPLFPRFPVPLGKNLPHPAMPNLPMPPLYLLMAPTPPILVKTEILEKLQVPPLQIKEKSIPPPITTGSSSRGYVDGDHKREEKGEMGVPKITFRFSQASSRPPTPDTQPRKIVIKAVVKNQDEGSDCPPATDVTIKREPSPELARISALITRPPKQKSASKANQPKQENLSEPINSPTVSVPPPVTPRVGSTMSPVPTSGSGQLLAKAKKGVTKPIQKIKGKELNKKVGMTTETEPSKEPVPFYYYRRHIVVVISCFHKYEEKLEFLDIKDIISAGTENGRVVLPSFQ
ncbi:hypothetical protein L9F63_016138, partial [Diploptera punctata]